jgi:sodium transport system permease protein
LSPILQVARKELRDMFRDKRVRSAAFIMPIVLIFGFMTLLGFVFGQLGKKENTKVHVVNNQGPVAELLKSAKFQIVEVDSVEQGKKMISDGQARLLLVLPEATSGQALIDAYIDPKQQTGTIAFSVVQGVLSEANKRHLATTLASAGIPETAAENLKLTRHEIVVGEKGGASDMLVGLLPYMIVIWAFYGGMGIASDLVAGEKDKNTLETLLISPVRRTDIVLGKFLALAVVCLMSSMSSLLGLVLLAVIKIPGASDMFKDGLGVTPLAVGLIVVLMLPLVALFASLLVGVSSFAKNSREAQTYLAQLSFVVVMPAVFSQFIGFTDLGSAKWVNAVPVLSTANNIRLALLGKPDFAGIGISIAVSLVLAAIALRWTVKMFNREQVLVRI